MAVQNHLNPALFNFGTPAGMASWGFGLLGLSLVSMMFLNDQELLVALPLLAIVSIVYLVLMALWIRDREVPFFDIGAFCLVVSACYGGIPLLMFLLSGSTWTILSDNRLFEFLASPTQMSNLNNKRLLDLMASPAQIGEFGWWAAIYLAAFGITYYYVRGRQAPPGLKPVARPGTLTAASIVIPFLMVILILAGIEFFFQIEFNPNHKTYWAINYYEKYIALPLLVRQVSHNAIAMQMVFKIALLLWLISNWNSKLARWCLALWLTFEALRLGLDMGARTPTLMLFLAAILGYHRMVRPLNPAVLVLTGALLVLAALGYGFLRDYQKGMEDYPDTSRFSMANEFQILYGTAFHLKFMKMQGTLPDPPWTLYFDELLMLIPQQILPIKKTIPSTWYLDAAGFSRSGGYMFGILSQGVVGYGVFELMIRGILLGSVFGGIHRLYKKRSHSFLWTLFYIWLTLFTYYTYRASTFYFIYFIVYRFLPAVLSILLIKFLLGKPLRPVPASR